MGGGKTTFVRGLARGLGSSDNVSSPTFTLSKTYKARNANIHHYDFYRLNDAGILKDQLSESLNDKQVVTVLEWGDIVAGVLPVERIVLEFKPTAEGPDEREIEISYPETMTGLIKKVETDWKVIKP